MFKAGLLLPNLALPIPTKFLASPAKTLGAFGLVAAGITIPYHVRDLGQNRGQNAITNHYRRTEGITHSG